MIMAVAIRAAARTCMFVIRIGLLRMTLVRITLVRIPLVRRTA